MWPNFINMLSAWQWLALSAVPPAIVALYFLKLRREPLEVPSTYLWRKSIEDLHVNSFWQKLRKNLLLALQLLLVLLIMLALLRPSWRSSSLVGNRFVFLIDNSASMSATDAAPTRLENAKQQAKALVEQMASGDKAMVISFSDQASVAREYTENRRMLQRAIDGIQPSQRPTALLPALKLAAGAAEQANDGADDARGGGTLYLFSDGKFPNVEDVVLGNLKPVFVPIGSDEAANVGIVAFNTKRHETDADRAQVFFQLANSGEKDVELDVALFRDNQQIDAKRVKVPARGKVGDEFPPLRGATEGILRLQLRHTDALELDNTAYAVLETPRRGRVLLVTSGNEPVQWALATLEAQLRAEVAIVSPETLADADHLKAAAAGAYDLIIYDRCRPREMPQANTFFLGSLPPTTSAGQALVAKQPGAKPADKPSESEPPRRYSLWSAGATAEEVSVAQKPQVLDTERAHPLMSLVELGDLFIGASLLLEIPPGGKPLIETTQGPVAGIAPREGFEDVVFGFEIIASDGQGERVFNTDWWRKQSFPSFWLNVLGYLGGGAMSAQAVSARPGEMVRLRSLSPIAELEVLTPSRQRIKVARGRSNDFPFTGAEQQGVYDYYEGDQLAGRFAVNLFDARESDITPRDGLENPIQVGPVEIASSANFEAQRSETWKFLLILALVVLLLEWYIYNRRVYI